jgi:hypothetical protein
VIYLIYTRTKFEKNIVKLYEEKFENWKENSEVTTSQKPCKTLVGLVFKKDDKISIELFDKNSEKLLEEKEFEIDIFKDKK